MKKLQLLIYILSAIWMLQSCRHEDIDVFGKSATERLNEAQVRYDKILTDATNGWRLEYMAGDDDATRRGAFNFLLKFEKGKVTAAVDALALSDINPRIDPFTKITSYYKLEQDMSVSLSFETYNSFLHYYHEQHGSYTTYKGDFEFSIIEADKDLIILWGKKYGNIMAMHRMPDNLEWDAYLKDVNKIIDDCSIFSKFELKQNGEKIASVLCNANYRYSFSITDENEKPETNALFTTTGIRFIDALTIKGKNIQLFDWNTERNEYICTDEPDITLTPILPPSYMRYENFIGTYEAEYKTLKPSEPKKTVTIEQNIKGKSFTLKGLTDFDIELIYNKRTGTISLLNQDIGKSTDNYTVGLISWAPYKGYIMIDPGYGMVSLLNLVSLESGVTKFLFEDNGVWGTYKISGFILYKFNSVFGSHTGKTRIGRYSDPEKSTFYSITLTKQ